MRHDVLNDLTTIRSILEIYRDTRDEKLLEDVLKKIDGSADFLKEMREVESMVSEGNLEPLKFSDVLKPIQDKYEGINLKVEGDCTVVADHSLTSVFDNLVRNSFTHGKADRIDIKITNKVEVCQVEVTDNGQGIPDDIRERVFEKGFSTNGTGLGLYIVKKTVERYGGSIQLKDSQQGTTFVLLFSTPSRRQESRDSGINVLGEVGWGTHICHFYQTRDDLVDVLIPYFRAGLDNNEHCIWITSELAGDEARELVEEQLPHGNEIEIISYDEWYYTDNIQQVLNGWAEKLNQALADGYDGLRVAGDAAWLDSLNEFIDYEGGIHRKIDGKKMIAVCSYPFNRLKTSEIADLTSRHHYTLVVREGDRELIENFEYKKTQKVLQKVEEKYRALVENANEAIVVVQDEKIMYANPRAMNVSGYSQEELMYKPFIYFIHPDDREFVIKRYKERVSGEGSDSYQFRFKDEKGNTRWANLNITSIEWDGRPATLNLLTDITAQKKAEERLQELITSYQELFDKSGDAIFVHDPDTADILDVNQRTCELYDYSREEALKLKVGDLSSGEPYTHEKAKEWVQKARTEGPQTFEWQGKKKDGTIFWEEVTLKKAVIGGNERILASVRDITERKRSEQALKEAWKKARESEKLYSTLVEKVNDMVFMLDSKGEVTFFNSYVKEHYSLNDKEAEQLFGTHLSFFWCDRSIDEVQNAVDKVIEQKEEYSIGCVCEDRHYLLKITPLLDSGELKGMVAVARDFTEHKKAEEALREREKVLADILDGSPVPTFVLDENHRVTHWNKACENLSGVSAQEVTGTKRQWYPWYPEERPTMADLIIDGNEADLVQYYGGKQLNHSLKEGAYEGIDFFPHLGENGKWLYFTACPLKDEDGRVMGAIETIQDVTEQKTVEEKLKENEERYRQLVDNVSDIPYTLDIEGVITYIGPQVEQYGYKVQEIVGRSFTEVIHPEDAEQVMYNLERSLETGEEIPSEFRVYTPEMGVRWFEERGTLVKSSEREVKRISGILRDVTERRQAEKHVEHLNSLLMAIRNVNQLIVQEQDLDKLLNGACELLLDTRGYLGCGIALLDENNSILPVAGAGAGGFQFFNYENLEGKIPQCVRLAIESKEEYIIDDGICETCAYREQVHDNRCSVIIPMKEYEQVTGIFFVTLEQGVEISGDEISLLQEVAGDLVFAIAKFKAEERLKESEAMYRATFEHTGTAMIVINEDTTIIMANEECERISGYSKEEIEGKKSWTEFVHPEDLERMMNYHSNRRKGEDSPGKYEFRLVDREGNLRNMFITIDLISGTKRSIASLMDVTHLRTLNKLLRVVSEINEVVARIKRPEVVLDAVCRNLKLLYDDVFTYIIKDGEPVLVMSEGNTVKNEITKKCPLIKALESHTLKMSTDGDICRECTEKLHKYALSIPLVHERQHGIITLHSNSDFNDEEITLLNKLASNIAFALSAHKVERDKSTAMEQLAKNLSQFDMAADRLRNPLAIIMSALELKDSYGKDKAFKIVQEQTERIEKELDEMRKEESATHKLLEKSKL
ncbi:MAG: PAS domain S-box protein [Archaeoglobaceae archaeon]